VEKPELLLENRPGTVGYPSLTRTILACFDAQLCTTRHAIIVIKQSGAEVCESAMSLAFLLIRSRLWGHCCGIHCRTAACNRRRWARSCGCCDGHRIESLQ